MTSLEMLIRTVSRVALFVVTPFAVFMVAARRLFDAPSDSNYRDTGDNFIRVPPTGAIRLAGIKGRF